jgi:hypothetical protein
MTDQGAGPKTERPPLPRDAFRAQRVNAPGAEANKPVIVTPHYDDPLGTIPAPAPQGSPQRRRVREATKPSARNPFDAYGERSSSRPYALRLPDPIDLVLRQIAAEQRTHPLRIIDRILHDHLKQIGRLPPSNNA